MTVARNKSVSRGGMAPENVTVLVLAALAVGLIIGQAVGRRQGLTVRKVELPAPAVTAAAPAAGAPAADSDAMMKATAPKDPQSVDEARQLVAQMGDSDAQSLIDLGNRKFSHKHYFLAIGFFEKALGTDPNRPEVWCDLAAAFRAVKDPASATKALSEVTRRRPEFARGWYDQAALQRERQDQPGAVASFRKYLALAPNGEHAGEAKAALRDLGAPD